MGIDLEIFHSQNINVVKYMYFLNAQKDSINTWVNSRYWSKICSVQPYLLSDLAVKVTDVEIISHSKCLSFMLKVFKDLCLLNAWMDLVDIWTICYCCKVLLSASLARNDMIKIMNLEIRKHIFGHMWTIRAYVDSKGPGQHVHSCSLIIHGLIRAFTVC